MTQAMRVLVLGGYGNFGARICRALANNSSIQLLVAGRSVLRAEAFARELGNSAIGLAFDITDEYLSDRFIQVDAQLIIHTAGPFQNQNYQVAVAAANAGAHYIDLADGRRFVCDFQAAMHDVFLKAGKTAITGASTVPALSSTVINALCQDWRQIDSIDTCIAPAQQAPRGTATLAAVLSYCGESISVWSDGRWQPLVGWGSPKKIEFLRMKSRLGASCFAPLLKSDSPNAC
jgi:saccharopine dehydrogenase-like NADP-dependent oxidoreductase